MKPLRILGTAILAVTMGLSITSCGNDDDAEIILDPTIKKTIVDEVLGYSSDNISAGASTAKLCKITSKDDNCPIEKFVLVDESNVLVFSKSQTRAFNSEVITCTYTISGENIIVSTGDVFGDITISIGKVVEIAIASITYPATKEDIPALSSVSDKNLCRTWKNAKYSAGIYFDKLPIYGATESEKAEVSDVRILKTAIMNKLIADKGLKDEGFAFLNNSITAANFLADGTVYITYADNTVEESKWSWTDQSNAKLKTTIDGTETNVDIRYKAGSPNTVYFVIDANLKGVGGLGVHSLTGRLVTKMTDK